MTQVKMFLGLALLLLCSSLQASASDAAQFDDVVQDDVAFKGEGDYAEHDEEDFAYDSDEYDEDFGHFEGDCMQDDDGTFNTTGEICDVIVSGSKEQLTNGGLDGTYKNTGCWNGLPRYTLRADEGARELWYSVTLDGWLFGEKAGEEESDEEPIDPIAFSLEPSLRPNFVEDGDWLFYVSEDAEEPSTLSLKIACEDGRVLPAPERDEEGLEEYDDADPYEYSDGAEEEHGEYEHGAEYTDDAEYDHGTEYAYDASGYGDETYADGGSYESTEDFAADEYDA